MEGLEGNEGEKGEGKEAVVEEVAAAVEVVAEPVKEEKSEEVAEEEESFESYKEEESHELDAVNRETLKMNGLTYSVLNEEKKEVKPEVKAEEVVVDGDDLDMSLPEIDDESD